MKLLERIRTGDYNLEKIQQNLINFTGQFSKVQLLDGILLKGLVVNTSLQLSHKLGRIPQGYIIVSKNANANVWNDIPFTKDFINLNSSGNVTIDMWVF